MITKGILKTINYNENSCTVRIPLFETASSNNEVILSAVFLTQPGSYNGYSEGDIVFIDFENNSLNSPIVLGKLYLGAVKEKATSKKGGLTVADLNVISSASLPLDTKLVFNASDSTVVPVEGGLSTYKSLLDIIKSLYKTETSITKATEESLENITKIKVEYLSQPLSDPEPTKENPNWDIVMPNYQDGYGIWQKTTCYNSRGQILSIEIICFSSIAATATYWLKCSTRVHNGSQQSERLEITSMIKLGSSPETVDEESVLTYRWSKGSIKDAKIVDPATPYRLTFENTPDSPIPNENLIIIASRNGVTYEQETITFAPLNTPVLVLSNENASIEYDSYGFTKMDRKAFVESTASVKLNNKDVEVKKYTWTVADCTADTTVGTSSATIKITDIDETADSATATCEAIYLDNLGNEVPLTKVFSISKVKQGRSLYKLDISNDFITIPAIDNGKGQIEIPDDFDWDYLTSHTVNAYYGDDLIEFTCSMSNPAEDTSEKAFHLKYALPSTIILKANPVIEDKTVNEVTFTLEDLVGKTGSIIYELYRGKSKVATAKFEATRLDSGTPATSYWLNISSPIHTGSRQTDAITIQPKLETGNSGQDNDILAKIRCQYVGESSYIEVTRDSNTGKITLPTPLQDKNILVEASQNDDFSNIYESETITFSPLNTPVIDLTNDSAALTYTAGGTKINKEEGKEDIVESTATLYLNGKPVEGVTYSWTYIDCIVEGATDNQSIKIKGLTAPKGAATCSVTYGGETFTKVFSITKQIQGEASTSYWLKTSNATHAGENQTQAIRVVAMKKDGTNPETVDNTAYLWYKFKGSSSWTKAQAGSEYVLNIENYSDADLTIFAAHNSKDFTNEEITETSTEIYDWETITYSPLNTPIVDLDNDTASLVYDADDTKIGDTIVSSTATLYLNGKPITSGISYKWTADKCTFEGDDNKATIKIKEIEKGAPTATATCKITIGNKGIGKNGQFAGKSYEKKFTISKQLKGDPTVSYWIAPSTKIIKINADNTISPDTVDFQIIKKSGTKAPEAITLTSGGSLKLKVGKNGQTLNDFNGKATDNIYSVDTEGVSTSIIIALYDNDTEIDRETISVVKDGKPGEDGEDGKSAYKIDIANDFVTIPTDYSGKIHLDTSALKDLTTHIVTLYYGEEAIKPNWISSEIPDNTMGLRYTVSTGLTATIPSSSSKDNSISVDITALTDNTDTGSILYELVKDKKVLASAKFETSKIKSGEPTSYYKLEVDCSTIVRKQDGTTVPEIIVAKGYKYTGSTKEEVELHLEYKLDNSTNWNAGTLPVNLKTEKVTKSLQLRMRFSDSQTFLDSETIPVVYDGVDGAGGDTFEVQQAFLWTSDYTYIPELPGDNLETTLNSEKKWALVAAPTKDNLNDNWKLVFISTRVKTTSAANEISYSPWDAPAVYLCKEKKAYQILKTAEGLFGLDGEKQGVYYTVEKTITYDGITFTAGKPYTPEELAKYASESAENRKNIKVYINAEYIKTGALTVGDKDKPLFQAGLDDDTVSIGGWDVEKNKLYSGSSTKRVTLQSSLINDSFVECIVSNGTQYIDTGLYINYNTDIVEVTYQPTTYDQNGMIFGQWNDANNSQAALYLYKDGKAVNFYISFDGEQKSLNTYINYTNLSKQTARIQKESSSNQLTIYVNDRATSFETYINSLPVATITSYIASGRRNDGSANWGFKGKIYSCKIWRDGSLIRNYVPYYKANIQTYGLFDLCNNTFTSSGSSSKFDGEYSSIYLGSEESQTAPFSVSNTGHVRASDVSLEGHIISDGGRIGGFTISDSSFTNGILGQNDFVAIASKDSLSYRVANITDEYKLIVGPSFGVTKTGAVNIANGNFTGEVVAKGGQLSGIESIECSKLKLGPVELTPINFNEETFQEEAITFTVTKGRASYIGSSTIYYVTITSSKKLAKAVLLPYMLVYATYTGTYGSNSYNNKVQNIYFNQKITFPANTLEYEISIIADSYDQYGSWTFNDVSVSKIGNTVSDWNSSNNSFTCMASVNTTAEAWALQFSQNLVPATTNNATLSLGVSDKAWDNLYCKSAYAETFYASSDLRLKENIKEFNPQKSILDLPVVEFDFKDSGKHQIGCIAQDLQKLFPELVETKDNGYLTIAENKLVYLLLLEVKKLNAKIESLSTNNKSKGELKQYD